MVFPGLRSCGVKRFFRRPNVIRAQEATSKGEGGGGGREGVQCFIQGTSNIVGDSIRHIFDKRNSFITFL